MNSFTLSPAATTFVQSGGRDVECNDNLLPGDKLTLLDDRGNELGLALADPDNAKLRVMATVADRFPAIDGALLGWRVERAFAWRKLLDLPAPDAAYRVLHGAGDGVPGFTCDVMGRFGVLYAYAPALVPVGKLLAEAVRGFAGLDGVVVKVRARGGADAVAQEIVGATPPEQLIVQERGVPFEVHLQGGLNVGLFTDMGEQRGPLARLASGRRVLNLFSYTGAFSVACARGGASSVTSVDTSDGVQAWARGNFARSGLDPSDKRWRFEVGDAVRFLARAVKDRERYDLVVIDPPTFSTARGAPWTLDRDYPALIAQAAAVVPEGGVLWLAANTHELGALTKLALKGLKTAQRSGAIVAQAGLPEDYPTLAAQPRDRYLQICVVRMI
jgi:23S rRNA (cytosine1962-C5)-methyltransferase